MEIMRDAKPWKLSPTVDRYKSTYMKDFSWHGDYYSAIQAHVPKPSYPPLEDLPKCYLPECQPSDLSPRRAGKLEILAEPIHDLSCCVPLPSCAPTAGTEGALVLRQQPCANLLAYRQFTQNLFDERQDNADKNKTKNLNSSVFIHAYPDLEWRSVYKQDYKPWTGIPSEPYTEEIRPSPVFPEDSRFNVSRWVSEYADSYSICLKRLDWSSPISAQWLPFGKDARWTPRWKECPYYSVRG